VLQKHKEDKVKKFLVLFVLLGLALLCQANWLQFQGNSAHTGLSEDAVVVNSLLWQDSLAPLDFFSGPVTSDGTIFVPTLGGLYCLDVNTGDLLWCQPGEFSGVPAIIGGRIVAVQAETLRCFTLDGDLLWLLGFPTRPSHPTVANGIIYLTAGRKVYAVDSDGAPRWVSAELRYGFNTNMTPCCYDSFVVVATRGGGTSLEPSTVVYVLSRGSGQVIKSAEYGWPEASNVTTPTVLGSRLYLAVLPGWFNASFIYSVKLPGNTQAWDIEYDPRVIKTYYASSAGTNDRVFFVGEGLQAYDTISGRRLWTANVGRASYSSPLVSAGVIWLGNDAGELFGIDAVSGLVRQRFQCGNAPLTSPATTSDGKLIICDLSGRLYCFGYVVAVEEDPTQFWSPTQLRPGIYNAMGQRLREIPSRSGIYFHIDGSRSQKVVILR